LDAIIDLEYGLVQLSEMVLSHIGAAQMQSLLAPALAKGRVVLAADQPCPARGRARGGTTDRERIRYRPDGKPRRGADRA